jgi:AcrR family transcriptional regulator
MPEATRPMSLRDRQKAEARAHLLDTAARLIAQRGYDETTIDDITEAAGSARATFYAYFPSKDQVVVALAEEMWDRAEALYAALGQLPVWSHDTILDWLMTVRQAWQENADRTHVVTHLVQRHVADKVFAYREKYVDRITENEGLWANVDESERRLRAMLVILQVEGFFGLWMSSNYDVDERSMATFVDVILGVLGVKPS